jgi:hypothetical protein
VYPALGFFITSANLVFAKKSLKNIAREELRLNQIKMRAHAGEGWIPVTRAPLSPEIIGFMGAYEI